MPNIGDRVVPFPLSSFGELKGFLSMELRDKLNNTGASNPRTMKGNNGVRGNTSMGHQMTSK